ncbi:putative peptide zinc metalloprotease protein [Rhodobacter aestuarii]|uniref:Putative peptide zinc metalloprotease protein n=1 Tax=Rhodobacter aestuarii TaxID=453582 RepID=A0A1N7KV39_9RHOB|nr:hypothetical protein [Rhodobacter aestuarii]PTV95553.1 putative peptide zinc metalloprotease protein [Rhodobacter aestuarii]SIS65455.1 putative peptide zinc metalloprotease protein [Rhodobacter aestuarii]
MARVQLHSEDWYRVSALCPRLRPQVDVALHDYRGKPWYVLTDKSSGRTFRVHADDFEILRRFDGQTRIDQIWNDIAWSHKRDLPPQDEFLELLSRLYEAGVVAVDAVPRAAQLAKGQTEKSREWIARFLKSPVSQKIALWNPSAVLETEAVTAFAHFVFGPIGFLLWAIAVIWGGFTALSYWTPLTANLGDRVLDPGNLLIMACVYPAVKLIHELGHALAVRRFGGTVTQVGVMFLVFVPMPYVDASQANAFRSHGARALVTAAGILAEFAIAGVAMILWAEADPGLWRAILFNTILLCTISTIFFNGNPLLRFDAYYVVSDLTRTPGLATRGQTLMGRIGKRLLGIDPGPDTETGGTLERVWLLFYAVASGIYRVVIVFSIAFGLADMLGMAGQILGVWVIIGGLIWPNLKSLRTLSTSPETLKRKWTVMQRTSALIALFVLVIAVIPLPLRTTVSAVIAPSPNAAVYARAEGFVEELSVTEGTVLAVGDPIMLLDREAMRTELEALEARQLATEARLRAAQDANEIPLVDAIQTELSAIADGLQQLQAQIAAINITAERAGEWMPALRPVALGMMVTRGQQLGWIIGPDDRRIVAQIPQANGPAVRSGITGARIMVSAGDVRQIDAQDISVRSDASRVLPDPLLADRMGGPIMTDLESPDDQFYALNPAFNLVIEVPLEDLAIGRVVQLKLSHPPTSLFNRYWPRVVTAVGARFGPGA